MQDYDATLKLLPRQALDVALKGQPKMASFEPQAEVAAGECLERQGESRMPEGL